MLDERDRAVLREIVSAKDEGRPGWRDPLWAYLLMIAGLALAGVDIGFGDAPRAAAGFAFAAGLFSLLISVPISRRVWRAHRLVRHAHEKGAFDE